MFLTSCGPRSSTSNTTLPLTCSWTLPETTTAPGSANASSRAGRRANGIYPNWLGDVLQLVRAEVLEPGLQLRLHLVVDGAGDPDSAGIGDTLQARRDVDAVAMDVVAFDDHVAQINADAEDDPLVVGLIGGAFRHAFLDFDSALDGFDDARELDQQSVARGLDDAAPTARDGRFDQIIEMGVETRTRSRLILAHETGVSDYVGSQNRCKPSLDAFFGHDTSLTRVIVESLFFDGWGVYRGCMLQMGERETNG